MLTCFAEGEVVPAVIGPEQRQFVGGRRPRGAALGRGTLVQRSMVGSPGRKGGTDSPGDHPVPGPTQLKAGVGETEKGVSFQGRLRSLLESVFRTEAPLLPPNRDVMTAPA